MPYVILDGKVFAADACAETAESATRLLPPRVRPTADQLCHLVLRAGLDADETESDDHEAGCVRRRYGALRCQQGCSTCRRSTMITRGDEARLLGM